MPPCECFWFSRRSPQPDPLRCGGDRGAGMAETRLVSLGDYRLAARVAGRGSPAVVCLSALGGDHEEWEGVVERLAPITTVVTYGRPALGGSDGLPPEIARRAEVGDQGYRPAECPAPGARTGAAVCPSYGVYRCMDRGPFRRWMAGGGCRANRDRSDQHRAGPRP
jgi:hypothetical protein